MRCCLSLLCMAVALFLPLPAMSFCQDPQPRLVCGEYFASQVVIEATLLKTVALGDVHNNPDGKYPVPEFPDAYVYMLRVNSVLRGKVVGAIRVLAGNDSGRAAFDWVPGREYLLFLSPLTEQNGMWALDGCGNSSGARSRSVVEIFQSEGWRE